MPPIIVLCDRTTLRWRDVARSIAAKYPTMFVVLNDQGLQGLAETASSGPVAPDDLAMRTLADGRAFLVQSTAGHPGHLLEGVSRATARGGTTVVHVYAPEPGASGVAPERVAELATLAYRSRAFPLLTHDPDGGHLSLEGNPNVEAAWTPLERVTREASGGETKLAGELTPADWAVAQARLQHHFRFMSKGHRTDSTLPVAEYLQQSVDSRGNVMPYVDVVDERNRHVIASVSERVIQSVEACARRWREWQAMASEQPVRRPKADTETPAAPTDAPADTTGASEDAFVQRLTERLLALSGYGQDPTYFDRTLRDFVTEQDGGTDPSGEETGAS